MATLYEIPVGEMIKAVAVDLKEKEKLAMPAWAAYVKTGMHKERVPEDADWWYIRAASILRKIYLNGPVGVQRLRTAYGGRKNRGMKPEHFYRSGGKIIRALLQEFDKKGFTEKAATGGRKMTSKGQSYLDKIASEVSKKK